MSEKWHRRNAAHAPESSPPRRFGPADIGSEQLYRYPGPEVVGRESVDGLSSGKLRPELPPHALQRWTGEQPRFLSLFFQLPSPIRYRDRVAGPQWEVQDYREDGQRQHPLPRAPGSSGTHHLQRSGPVYAGRGRCRATCGPADARAGDRRGVAGLCPAAGTSTAARATTPPRLFQPSWYNRIPTPRRTSPSTLLRGASRRPRLSSFIAWVGI